MCEITFRNPLYKNVVHAPANRPAFLHTEEHVHTSWCLIKAYDEIQNVTKLSCLTNTEGKTEPAAEGVKVPGITATDL